MSTEIKLPPDAIVTQPTAPFVGHVVDAGSVKSQPREVIEEQPLRIIVNGKPLATLMRTPGGEIELTLGFLLSEGMIQTRAEVGAISFCRDGAWGKPGEVLVRLTASTNATHGYRDVLSSCSLCSDAWIEKFADGIVPFSKSPGRLYTPDIFRLRALMSASQPLFDRTGASHAAALIEPRIGGDSAKEIVVVREDVGRHNALDKAIGAALGAGMHLDRSLLLLSSRLSFEMVSKAARAGISDVAGVSAPSAVAIRLAQRLGMFLAGFVRGETMTVYAGVESLDSDESSNI